MTRRRATTVAPEGRLVLAESAGNSRLFIYMLGNYLHRIERERRTVYFGDLDLARVAEIIGAAGVEPGMRVEKGRARYVLQPGMPQEPARQAAFARGLQQTVAFMNECLENGVVRWVDAKRVATASSPQPTAQAPRRGSSPGGPAAAGRARDGRAPGTAAGGRGSANRRSSGAADR